MTKLLWLDLEMTGLDVQKERIIEVAGLITDFELKPISEFHSVVYQDASLLEQMDDWNQKQHSSSGLVGLISKAPKEEIVEANLISWCSDHFDANEPIILAGNSIWQDRRFLEAYFIKFSQRLHYRMLDVSSWKLHFLNKKIEFKKSDTHRAVDDIKESIEEYKFYLSHLKI